MTWWCCSKTARLQYVQKLQQQYLKCIKLTQMVPKMSIIFVKCFNFNIEQFYLFIEI